MAQLKHQLYPEIIIDTDSVVVEPGGSFQYKGSIDGGSTYFELPSSVTIDPVTLEQEINKDGSPAFRAMDAVLGDVQFLSQGPETILGGTVSPALQLTPANLFGAPADIGNLLAQATIDAPINLLDWAFKGFEGDMPSERYASADPKDVFAGSAQLARGMENIGDVAREADAYLDKEMGTFGKIPYTDIEVPYDLGLSDAVLGAFKFDTTPDESTKARKYISLITQIVGAAPFEGAAIGKLAKELSKLGGSPTSQRVYEALSEMSTKTPLKAAALETGAGALAGTGMVTGVEALEAAYPEAPQWMKNTVMAGGGIAVPVAGMTVGSTVYDVALKTPIVRMPLRIARGAMESLTPKGIERAATRSLSKMGGDWKDRNEIIGVHDQFKLAIAEGRDIDRTTRIAFTTPQLARNEARILEAQLNAAEKNMPTAEVAEQRQLIQNLRKFSTLQEGHLATLTAGGNVGNTAYSRYSDRLMDRRDKILAALDESIFKLDLGGKVGEDIPNEILKTDYEQGLATNNFEYNANRIRAFQEGRLVLDPEQSQALTNVYESSLSKIDNAREEALFDAQERIQAIRDSMPDNMSDSDRDFFNMWIRRELDTSYKEIDSYEDLLWNNISGLDQPKTNSVKSAEGADLGPEILIDGVPIGEHFAAKVAALDAGEDVNQSKYLWKLSGRDALTDQASKGGGPDAQKVAKQNLIVKSQESIVAERQRELDLTTDNLTKIEQAGFIDPKVVAARAEVARFEAELKQIPTGTTIEDTTVIRRANAVKQKLTGAQAKLAELSKQNLGNPALNKAQNDFERAQTRLNESQIKLETARGNLEISLGKGVEFEGSAVKLEDEINNSSILGVKIVDGVAVGRKGQEVQNIISTLKKEMSSEQGGPSRNPQKVMSIGRIIDDLQRAIADPENFSVDTTALDAARKMTAAKKQLYEKGSVGKLRGFTTKGEPQVSVERAIEKIAPITGQKTSLRELQTALTPIATGEGTPFRLVQAEDGSVTAQLDPNYNLERYATEPPTPFESIRVDGGRSLGLKVSENTPATEANIKLIRDTLWDRFRTYGAGDKFDTSGAAKWIEKNSAALNWLKKATGKPTGFEDLVAAERVVDSMRSATKANLDKTVDAMRKDGAFNEQFTEEGFRILVDDAAKRESNLSSAAVFLDEASPLVIGQKFVDRYLNNPNTLDETLKVLENGALPDGTNPALDGFKQAVAENIVKRGLTGPREGTTAAKEAQRLSAFMGGAEIKLWDPQKLFELAQDPKVGKLLGDLYGPDAAASFAKVAEGARLQQEIGPSATKNIQIKDLVSDEWAGNVGRFIGGWSANFLPVSGLVLTGLGRRYGINVIGNVRGEAMENLIVEFLMNPKIAAAAIDRWPTMDPNKKLGLLKRAQLYAHKKFISDNARRIRRLSQRPGTVFEIGAGATEMREPDDESIGPQSSLQRPLNALVADTPQQVASAMPPPRAPVPASALSQVSLAGPPPMAQAPASQETLAGLNQLGMPLFAKEGGYIEKSGIMSVKPKARQLVG